MAKYHISPTTGRPNQCTATVRACPVGGEQEHFPSKEAARDAYEAKMSEVTVAPVHKRQLVAVGGGETEVTSLDAHRSRREASDAAEDAVAKEKFVKAVGDFPSYQLTGAEGRMLVALEAGKKVAPEKLDAFLDAKQEMTVRDAFNSEKDVEAASAVLAYVRAKRAQDPTPDTRPTIDSFEPASQTLFSNPKARQHAGVMGKAIRREAAHGEWMHELAREHRESGYARMTGSDDENTPEEYLNSAAKCADHALRSEARVQAQLRELQHCYDTDDNFRRTADIGVRSMLAKGRFRSSVSSYDGVPIGEVRKVK